MTRSNTCRRLAAALSVPLLVSMAPPAAAAACDSGIRAAAPSIDRLVTARDLVRLRDIGRPDGSLIGGPSALAVSPDGNRVAFILNQADPEANDYCRSLVVLELEPGSRPTVIDRGGELITATDVQRGLYIAGGFPALVQPVWSPDGQWVAYLRRDKGVTQGWRARADGGGAEPVTRSEVDIEAVGWSSDGLRFIYASRPGLTTSRREREAEGRVGYLYDDRFMPQVDARPLIRAPVPRETFAVDLARGASSPAGDLDSKRLPHEASPGAAGSPSIDMPEGGRVWAERESTSPLAALRLWASDATGRRSACPADACSGAIVGLWRIPGSPSIAFLRREGWANGRMGLYRWRPGQPQPRRVLLTTDVLNGCALAGVELVCTRENAVQPRIVVLLNPENGRVRDLFDPNPEFEKLRLGSVERLEWRNHLGLEAWGDLVLPPGHRPGDRLPLVIVQYHSDGFLRGGTGDEYPIHALAARGFAVLSIERPAFFAAALPELTTWDQINAANAKDWAERRSLLSSLVAGVRRVIGRGIADPDRIGITGLSDGASTARFALVNTRMFAAAAISTCCIDPKTTMTYGGIAWADSLREMGYPPATRDDPEFWRPYSMALNAADMDTPLLMQLADDEYLLALETFTALREHGKPVEMYVYPDEHHVKWQPAHRLAVYTRNIDWFDFWLRGREDADPAKQAQYARWRAMRATLATEKPGQP